MPPAELRGLLLDIGGVVHNTGVRLVGRLAEREPAMRPVIEEIGGIASDRDELWQRMLRRQVSEREYWAQRAGWETQNSTCGISPSPSGPAPWRER